MRESWRLPLALLSCVPCLGAGVVIGRYAEPAPQPAPQPAAGATAAEAKADRERGESLRTRPGAWTLAAIEEPKGSPATAVLVDPAGRPHRVAASAALEYVRTCKGCPNCPACCPAGCACGCSSGVIGGPASRVRNHGVDVDRLNAERDGYGPGFVAPAPKKGTGDLPPEGK